MLYLNNTIDIDTKLYPPKVTISTSNFTSKHLEFLKYELPLIIKKIDLLLIVNCDNLETINMSMFTIPIDELEIINCPRLTYLDLSSNKFTKIHLENIAIDKLEAGNTSKLQNITLSKLDNLTQLDTDYFLANYIKIDHCLKLIIPSTLVVKDPQVIAISHCNLRKAPKLYNKNDDSNHYRAPHEGIVDFSHNKIVDATNVENIEAEVLDLSFNMITEFIADISMDVGLLNLNNNKLVKLDVYNCDTAFLEVHALNNPSLQEFVGQKDSNKGTYYLD